MVVARFLRTADLLDVMSHGMDRLSRTPAGWAAHSTHDRTAPHSREGWVAVVAAVTAVLPQGPAGAAEPTDPVPVGLSSYFDNDGISSASARDGDFDGSRFTFPAEELPPGGRVTVAGVPYEFPGSAAGSANNVVARGQTIALPPGRYAAAHLLAASSYGNTSGAITAHYADGTTSATTVTVPDWYSGGTGGLNLSFRYRPDGGRDPHPVYAEWLTPARAATVSVEADGVRTVRPATVTRLAPGEQARVQVGIAKARPMPDGTAVPGAVVARLPGGASVRQNDAFYITSLSPPGNRVVVSSPVPIKADDTITMLGYGGGPLRWTKQNGQLAIEVPAAAREAGNHSWVFKIS